MKTKNFIILNNVEKKIHFQILCKTKLNYVQIWIHVKNIN